MNHGAYFESLKALIGCWSGKAQDGQTIGVTYSIHANNSVLLEHWRFRNTDALTLYHLDRDQLMATHYCPLCNQPRLNLTAVDDGKLHFTCVSATNLIRASDEHQHAFDIKLIDGAHFWRSESYLAGSKLVSEAITYTRD
jgi:hypothetical protein